MTNFFALTNGLLLPMAKRLTAVDRWSAVKNPWSGFEGENWVATAMGALVLLVGVTVVGIVSYGYIQRRKWAKIFANDGRKKGLRENDLKLLRFMTSLVKMKNADAIYTAEDSFNQAAAQLMQNDRTIAMSPDMRAELVAQVSSMREKIGFASSSGESSGGNLISSRQIPVGAKVFITPQKYTEAVTGTIIETGEAEFAIETDEELTSISGDDCVVRHSIEASAWEFDTQIVRCEQRRVTLNHVQQARLINRRKFPRVRVDKSANVARFALFSEDPKQEVPRFTPARLRQIGGSGMLLQVELQQPMPVTEGERVLITASFAADCLVQGLGRIRRKSGNEQEGVLLGIELIALEPPDMAELVRQTNLAVVQEANKNSQAETVAVG